MNTADIWDWSFFWDVFSMILKVSAAFVMLIVAIIAVGMLLQVIINAIRNGKKT